ncbi:hypothetical protein K502DRAFT_362013 [Neoconidiobolus thromboides FSU 785]|nr:hypothetical protein K502DRAFT_362013 [Neoconidiobolus thromboides FSU 785]
MTRLTKFQKIQLIKEMERTIPVYLVVNLKNVIREINSNYSTSFLSTGLKKELVERILEYYRSFVETEPHASVMELRKIIKDQGPNVNPPINYQHNTLPSVNNGAQQPIRPQYQSYLNPSMKITSKPSPINVFRLSPSQLNSFKNTVFYSLINPIDPHTFCPSNSDRHSVVFQIKLNDEIIKFLSTPGDNYKPGIKLLCAQVSDFSPMTQTSNCTKVSLKYPHVSELYVNGTKIASNIRGKKNKADSVRAPDLNPYLKLVSGFGNHVELIYMNLSESLVMVPFLVKNINIDSIIKNIVEKKSMSKEKVFQQLFNKKEDDIEVTVELSLRCPLLFNRIKEPFRSKNCVHAQCFDAYNFLEMNEQMETWECPVCQKYINPWEDFIRDNFFMEILQNTPEDAESVFLEPSGAWSLKTDKKSEEKRTSSKALLEEITVEKKAYIEEVDLLSSSDPSCSGRDIENNQTNSLVLPGEFPAPENNPADTIIDLTLSDDETGHDPPSVNGGQSNTPSKVNAHEENVAQEVGTSNILKNDTPSKIPRRATTPELFSNSYVNVPGDSFSTVEQGLQTSVNQNASTLQTATRQLYPQNTPNTYNVPNNGFSTYYTPNIQYQLQPRPNYMKYSNHNTYTPHQSSGYNGNYTMAPIQSRYTRIIPTAAPLINQYVKNKETFYNDRPPQNSTYPPQPPSSNPYTATRDL